MKKILLLIIIALTTSIVLAQGEKVKPVVDSKPVEIVTTQNATQYKVTFIELGSLKCIPCKMMQPIMAEVEKEYPNVQVVFYDVWTEEGAPYAEKYGIRGIPTQIFLDKDGKEYFRHTGFFPKADLVRVLENGLSK